MPGTMRAIECDECHNDAHYPAFCWKCLGSGYIPLIERQRPRIWGAGKWLAWIVLGAGLGLATGYGIVHWLRLP